MRQLESWIMSSRPEHNDIGEQGTLELTMHIGLPEDAALKYDLQARIERLVFDSRSVSAKVSLEAEGDSSIVLIFAAMTHPLPRDMRATIYGQDVLDEFLAWLASHNIVNKVDNQVVIKMRKRGS